MVRLNYVNSFQLLEWRACSNTVDIDLSRQILITHFQPGEWKRQYQWPYTETCCINGKSREDVAHISFRFYELLVQYAILD